MAAIVHAHAGRAEMMCWPDPAEEPVVKTIIQKDDARAKRAAELSGRTKENILASSLWRWWMDGS